MTNGEFEALPEWKPVHYKDRDWPYIVSKYGEVKNAKGKILKPYMRGQRKGSYPCVKLHLYGYKMVVDLHRLTAIHYISNPRFKAEVNHKDSNHLNPAAMNLEWCTRRENEQHKYFMNSHLEFMEGALI